MFRGINNILNVQEIVIVEPLVVLFMNHPEVAMAMENEEILEVEVVPTSQIIMEEVLIVTYFL